jgi:hypothetical protein
LYVTERRVFICNDNDDDGDDDGDDDDRKEFASKIQLLASFFRLRHSFVPGCEP